MRSRWLESQTFTGDQSRHTVGCQIPLHFGASNAFVDATRVIIQQDADVNSRDNNGRTILHHAINKCQLVDDKEFNNMKFLLDHGSDVEAQDNERMTPLNLAANKGQVTVVQLLLDHGASIHARNKESWTPLHHASCSGY